MTMNEKRTELNRLSRAINYKLRMNDGCTDAEILALMEEYKLLKESK